MIDKNIIYNDEYLVVLPSTLSYLLEPLEYTYGKVFLFDALESVDKQVKIISQSNYKQIILVDYIPEYKSIISSIKDKSIYKVIFTKSLGLFYDQLIYKNFNEIIKMYDKKKSKKEIRKEIIDITLKVVC